MTKIELITKDDLEVFKTELLKEIELIFQKSGSSSQEWLKSSDVKKRMKISTGSLQNLRINGTLPYTRVGGIIYYKPGDIDALMESGFVD